MSAPAHDLLHLPLVFLGAAVLAVPLARWARLGSILGYLVAGVLIGPQVAGLVTEPDTILEVAEIGVVLMMFLVGLELEPRRLWQLRRPIFGWGSVQLLGSTALLMALALLCGLPWRLALVGSLGLAMSSTAVAMAVLGERNLGPTAAGQSILSVALLQDIAAIPILALVPALALTGVDGSGSASEGQWHVLKAVGAIAVLILGGRLALRPALRWIAGSATPEIFTAAALLLVLATAALMQAVGLSMALGAFLAGVLLAESEYRHELETDLEPFKGLLLGLFFIAVGMGLDLQVLLHQPLLVAGLLAALLVLKGVLLLFMGRAMGLPLLERPVFVILLAQGGEFGFVVFQLGQQAGLLSDAQASALVAAVALSLGCTPALLAAVDRWLQPRLSRRGGPALEEIREQQRAPVIIAGFGRYGQIVGRLLYANGHEATVLEHDAHTVEGLRRFDWRVFYGDATRLDLLRTAGAETAAVLVIAVDDVAQSLAIAELAREHFPQLQVVARARNVQHFYRLQELGVQHIERETFESALLSGRSVLELLGVEPAMARRQAWRFRQHNSAQLRLMAQHRNDQDKVVAMVKQGRQQLETLMAQEREARAQVRHRHGWNPAEGDEHRPE